MRILKAVIWLMVPGLATLSMAMPASAKDHKDHIVFARMGSPIVEWVIANGDGTAEQRLLNTYEYDYSPSLSSDGKWVVFTSERHGSADIYRVRADDGAGLEQLTEDPAYDDQAALSPDGKELAFVSTRAAGTADIWILNLQNRRLRNLTNGMGGHFFPSWSPDGQWLAFSSDRNTEFKHWSQGW
jgi:TolB protein